MFINISFVSLSCFPLPLPPSFVLQEDGSYQNKEMYKKREALKFRLSSMPWRRWPEYKVVIHSDKTPAGENERHFNAPSTSEVAVILAGEQHGNRDIVLQLRNNSLQRIAETHRSNDALRYPLILWHGEDGYHLQWNTFGLARSLCLMSSKPQPWLAMQQDRMPSFHTFQSSPLSCHFNLKGSSSLSASVLPWASTRHKNIRSKMLASTCKAHAFLMANSMLVVPQLSMAKTFSSWHHMEKHWTLSVLKLYKNKTKCQTLW